jgi:hypothetical protein
MNTVAYAIMREDASIQAARGADYLRLVLGGNTLCVLRTIPGGVRAEFKMVPDRSRSAYVAQSRTVDLLFEDGGSSLSIAARGRAARRRYTFTGTHRGDMNGLLSLALFNDKLILVS